MPAWLTLLFEICGGILALTGVLALAHRKIIVPLKAAWTEALGIFRRLLSAAEAVQRFAAEMHSLSGAFTLFAVEIKQQVDENTERLDRLEERNDLVVDLQADVERIQREFRPGS